MRRALIASALLLAGCTSNAPAAERVPEDRPRPERWDPRDVEELPAAGREVLPGLPRRVAPPDRAAPLAGHPVDAAVLTVERSPRRLLLLGTDGSWREVRPAETYGREALAPDGTRLAVLLEGSVELWHLPAGERSEIDLPAGFRAGDFSRLDWIDGRTLLLDDRRGGWRIDLATGESERTPYPRRFSWTVATGGDVLETTDPARPPALVDWSAGAARRVDLAGVGTPLQVRAGTDVVAGTAYGDGAVVAFAMDPDAPQAVRTLRMRDFEANYSNWALRTAHVLEDGSVLLWIAIPGRRSEHDGWRLVHWEPETDALEIVTASDANPTWSLTFARDLLEDAGPWDPVSDDLPLVGRTTG